MKPFWQRIPYAKPQCKIQVKVSLLTLNLVCPPWYTGCLIIFFSPLQGNSEASLEKTSVPQNTAENPCLEW